PPPLALARRLRASLGPQALSLVPLQDPESLCRAAKNRVLLLRWPPGNRGADHIEDLIILTRQCADRPIRPNHESLRTKSINRRVDVPVQVLDCPSFPVRLGDET